MKPARRATKVVVITSVMLSFISFWRAAAIVLNDLGSSAFYVGGIAEHHLFTSYKQLLFTHVIALAEKEGKTVHLLVVPSSNILDAIALTAAQLDSAEVIEGPSPLLSPEVQAERFRKAWVKLRDQPEHQVCFRIIDPDGSMHDFPI